MAFLRQAWRIDIIDEINFIEIERIISLSQGGEELIVEASDEEKVQDFISGEDANLILGSSILFDFASDYLKESSYPLLSGHTDNVGPDLYNVGLSERRAESVATYFIKKGLDRSRFKIKGYGFHEPIASNDTPEGRSKNRRVVFSINK